MRKHVYNIFMRPLIGSFVSAAVVFVVLYTLLLVAPQPRRALYAFSADPGQFRVFSAAAFVVYGTPTGFLIFVVLKCVAAFRGRQNVAGSLAHGRDTEDTEPSSDVTSQGPINEVVQR
jgi:glycerol uptake facilitator-like aquaporin